MEKSQIAACVILYHPAEDDLLRDIRAISDHIGLLILWHNSPEKVNLPEDLGCERVDLGDGTNKYIAEPLNACFRYCSEHGYKWLLTMDQDSEFEDFGSFLESLSGYMSDDIAIYAPNVNNRYPISDSPLEIESTITSGSFCSVDKCLEIGGFRESYQIYWVDSEYCHRVHLSGKRILAFPGNNLKQKFGNLVKVHGVECFNYSPTTLYFMFRNMLWMHREYKVNPDLKCVLYSSQLYVKGILIGEKNKWQKIKSVLRGTWHGLFHSYAPTIAQNSVSKK